MAIIGIGTDLARSERFRKFLDPGNKVLERIFSDDERRYSLQKRNPVPHLAARFAAKEAFLKAKEKFDSKPFHDAPAFEKAGLADLLQEIIESGQPIHCLEVESGWIELHSMENYRLACSMVR